jgi:hypothetical protein
MAGLDDYVIDNPSNKDNLNNLLRSFDKESFIPFIGAGPSAVLGASDWGELTDNLCKDFHINIKKKKLDGKVDYPKIFSNIYKKLSNKNQFYNKLFENIRPTKTEITGFHISLVELFNVYVTTNYDNPIEVAFKRQHNKELQKYFFSCYGINNLKNCIVYLHGHKDIDFCIIKKEDYDYFYPTISNKNGMPIIEKFLSEVFTNKSIIIAGFSFDDLYIYKYLNYLYANNPFKEFHYWLIDESFPIYAGVIQRACEYRESGHDDKADNVISEFFQGKINIKPIVYRSNQHIFIEKLFQKLKETLPVSSELVKANGIPAR